MDPKRKIQKVDSDIDIKNDSIGSKSLEHAENVVEDNGDTVVENKIKKSSDECLQQREESQKEITKKQNNSKSETQKGSARKRPNCFLSIPITNQEALEKLSESLKKMIEGQPEMQQITIPVEKLHLTLGVFNLESESQVNGAKDAMKESLGVIKDLKISFPIPMKLSGLGSFSSGVLFVKVAGSKEDDGGVGVVRCEGGNTEKSLVVKKRMKVDDEIKEDNAGGSCEVVGVVESDLKEVENEDNDNEEESLNKLRHITNILLEKFKDKDLSDPGNNKPFTPHITLAKASKAKFYQRKKFKTMLKKGMVGVTRDDFGCQEVGKIDLCWMTQLDNTGKGYKIINSIDLVEDVVVGEDDSKNVGDGGDGCNAEDSGDLVVKDGVKDAKGDDGSIDGGDGCELSVKEGGLNHDEVEMKDENIDSCSGLGNTNDSKASQGIGNETSDE